jgi:riboflavin biosynthesis pyrimidine reductase
MAELHAAAPGRGQRVWTLVGHGLVDEYILLVHPLILGSGLRLFTGTQPMARR